MNGKITKRARVMKRLGPWAATHRGKVLLIVILVTAVISVGLVRINIEMTFFSIMPRQSQQVRDLEHISDVFPFASNIVIVVDGRSITDKDIAEKKVRQTVDALSKEFSKAEYQDWLSGVYGRIDNDFMKTHGLMLLETDDLKRMTDIYGDLRLLPLLENLNNDFEREYSGNSMNLEADESIAAEQIRGLGELLNLLDEAASGAGVSDDRMDEVSDALLFRETYMLNRDGDMGLVFLLPTFTMNDLGMLATAIPAMEKKAAVIAAGYGCEIGLTGMPVVAKDEMASGEQGLAVSMLVALVLILLLLFLVFRMFAIPLITGIPLVIGIIWTVGITGLTLKRLNMMTAMYMIALLGLGIDYAIHILTTYIQERDDGKVFIEAIGGAYLKSGPGILTGALTTAITFFVLMISKTEIMRELGFVAGSGILCEFAAMMLILPALLGKRYDRFSRKGRQDLTTFTKIHIRADLAAGLGSLTKRLPLVVAIVLFAIGLVLSSQAGRVRMEDNLMNMEAKGLRSIELQDEMVEEFGMAPDGVYILSKDPNKVKLLSEKIEKLDSVKQVESIGPFLVPDEEYGERSRLIDQYLNRLQQRYAEKPFSTDRLIDELYRLEMNLLEMEDLAYMSGLDTLTKKIGILTGRDMEGVKVQETALDRIFAVMESGGNTGPVLEDFDIRFSQMLKTKMMGMTSTEKITINMLPEIVRNSYISKDGKEYLISVVPRQNPWEGDFRKLFSEQVSSVIDRGTGMIYAANQLNRMAETDGIRALVLAVATICILLLIDFRNIQLVLFNLVPLALSIGSLIGIMALTGIKFDFINFIALPLLIGIGIDDAVHISHRYLYEGVGHIDRVVAKTGTAVLLTSLTTIIGFGSFIPSIMRGLRSTGIVLSIAMALACIFSIVMFPALLVIIREKCGIPLSAFGPGKGDAKK